MGLTYHDQACSLDGKMPLPHCRRSGTLVRLHMTFCVAEHLSFYYGATVVLQDAQPLRGDAGDGEENEGIGLMLEQDEESKENRPTKILVGRLI